MLSGPLFCRILGGEAAFVCLPAVCCPVAYPVFSGVACLVAADTGRGNPFSWLLVTRLV